MLSDDVKRFDRLIDASISLIYYRDSWHRIKTALAESSKPTTSTGSPKLLALCKRVVAHADTGVALPVGHPIIDEMREQLRTGA